MISRSEIKTLLKREPAFDDIKLSLRAIPKIPKGMVKETREVIAIARKFNQEVVRPSALALDRKMQENPDHIEWDLVKKANDWGFYTMWIPKIFGGKGYSLSSIAHFSEEIASECLSMVNMIGAHYLGYATLCATWNMKLIDEISRDIVKGEKAGNPTVMTLAITEPGAGTDMEEVELTKKGNITCHAKRVDGGYLLNGTKVFITDGHVGTWHMVVAYSDLKNPTDTPVLLAVKTGSKGFSFGKNERKMGVKGAVASELIFKDCFVPDQYVGINREAILKNTRSVSVTLMNVIDYVVSASRPVIASFGVGAARGAFQEALSFALNTEMNGKLLINHEWAQSRLAEMYKNVALGRLAYTEANYANSMEGLFGIVEYKPLYYMYKLIPSFMFEKIAPSLMKSRFATWLARKVFFDLQTDGNMHRTSGWASLAKFAGTDAGVKNCQMAVELMGQAGLRHDRRVEKLLRDAKLLQIYEGTNQLNRINLFKCLIGRNFPQVKVFEQE